MWSHALDRMVDELVRDADVDWSGLRALSGSAQQHGSVYVNALARGRLGSLEPGIPLVEQIGDLFARRTSPIWMDSSTTTDCAAIEAAIGGPRALATLTGSRAFERFTGPQIRKFARGGSRRLRVNRPCASRELVAGVPARRPSRRDRPRRRIRHEPDGPDEPALVAGRSARDGARIGRRSCRRSRIRGVSPARCRRTGSGATVFRRPRLSSGPATIPAASSAPDSSAKDWLRYRSGRATRSSASCRRLNRARTAPGTCSRRRPARTWA